MAILKHTRIRGKRGRPPTHEGETVRWNVHVPEELSAQWELLLQDPVTGKMKYAAKTFYVVELLRLMMQAFKEGTPTIDVSHLASHLASALSEGED